MESTKLIFALVLVVTAFWLSGCVTLGSAAAPAMPGQEIVATIGPNGEVPSQALASADPNAPVPTPEEVAAANQAVAQVPGATPGAQVAVAPAPQSQAIQPSPVPAPSVNPTTAMTTVEVPGPNPALAGAAAQALPPEYQGAEVSVILSRNQFYPSVIRLRSGVRTRLLFTSVNRKPAALIVEGLQLQRWLATQDSISDKEAPAKYEMTRELDFQKITDIFLDPAPGTYSFHDALSGARGEILVE